MQVQTEGIVLRATKYSEADLIVNIFTKKFGKIGAYAKHARRMKSPLMSATQIFSLSNMTLSSFDGRYKLVQADLIDNNFSISSSYAKTYLGYYFLQFVEKISLEEHTNLRLFELLKSALASLKRNENILLQKIIFDLKIIDIFGYKPVMSQCTLCGKNEQLGNNFNISEGGRVCFDCMQSVAQTMPYNFRLDSTSFRLMDFILKNDYEIILQAKISDIILMELNTLLDKYIDYHFDNLDLHTRKMLIFKEEL